MEVYCLDMYDRVVRVRLMVVVLLGGISLVVWLLPMTSGATSGQYLEVTFLDVGQGDAILIETPGGVEMLIDGGPDGTVLRELSRELGWHDRTIDVVVGTHPDLDHIGGLVDVLERYDVSMLITTENTGETTAAAAYQEAVVAEGTKIVYARAGQTLQLGSSTVVTILSPARDPSMLESNTASIVLQVRYGETEFMLTGDAPKSIEDYLVTQYGEQLESEVLKLGHHGSDTSTSELFLDAVDPDWAVASAGADNRYGHPHQAVLARTQESGAETLSTSLSGSITFHSDGVRVWVD